MSNNKLEILYKMELITFPLLKFGWDKFWCEKKDIIDYATSLLTQDKYFNNNLILLLGGADFEDDYTVKELLSKLIIEEHLIDNHALDKWKLAFLLEIQGKICSDNNKIDCLQLTYSTFDYSEDMSSLCIYNNDGVSPLKAMNTIIENKLKIIGAVNNAFLHSPMNDK